MRNLTILLSFIPLISWGQCNTDAVFFCDNSEPFTFVQASYFYPSMCLDILDSTEAKYAYVILEISQGGELNMLVNGDQTSGYVDVAVYDVTGSTNPCQDMGNASQIACNYAVGGANGCNEFGSNFGCVSSVPAPTVNTGDVLMIMVENWSDVQNNFTITLSDSEGSAQSNCNSLPVELVSFKGDCNLLEWETASENNNNYFLIEKSIDSHIWEDVARVDGMGNTTSNTNYSYKNNSVGLTYYRLSQFDYDAKGEVLETIVINCPKEDAYEVKYYNIFGQEVSYTSKGIVMDLYSDGTYKRK